MKRLGKSTGFEHPVGLLTFRERWCICRQGWSESVRDWSWLHMEEQPCRRRRFQIVAGPKNGGDGFPPPKKSVWAHKTKWRLNPQDFINWTVGRENTKSNTKNFCRGCSLVCWMVGCVENWQIVCFETGGYFTLYPEGVVQGACSRCCSYLIWYMLSA